MRRLACLVALALAIAIPTGAHAQVAEPPLCSSFPHVVYMQVGDTQTNLLRRLGRELRDNRTPEGDPNPITLAYITKGSCINIEAIYTGVAIPAGTSFNYLPSKAEDPSWNADDPDPTKSLPLACKTSAAIVPEIANSALFNSACTTNAAPAGVQLTQGPNQAYVIAVPKASSQTSITFEEAYFVFGFGMAGLIAPWIDEMQMFTRAATTSTLLAWAANISVPSDRWKGKPQPGSPQVVDALEKSTAPGAAIGLLGAEVYDAKRATLTSLAFRAKGQYAAYYPDSTSSSRDKKNVRDGHYTVWSPTIWMDKTNVATGLPLNPDTRYVIDLIAGKDVTPAPSFPVVDIVAKVGLVPECAMGVNRSFEGGPLTLYRPAASCACKFESLVDQTSCTACTTTCGTGVCRAGYCEDH